MARILETVNAHLRARGFLLEKGTLVDASIFNAPSSAKNKEKARDPAMHQARNGNQWYFGAKAHIGSDADSRLVHTVIADLLYARYTKLPGDNCLR